MSSSSRRTAFRRLRLIGPSRRPVKVGAAATLRTVPTDARPTEEIAARTGTFERWLVDGNGGSGTAGDGFA